MQTKLAIPIKIVICSSLDEKDGKLRNKLKEHLSPLKYSEHITMWDDREILAGANREKESDSSLNEAHLIVLLVSAPFLDSDYCQKQMKRALEHHRMREAHVIPVIIRSAPWESSPLSELQILPRNGKALTQCRNRDQAFENVAGEIRKVVAFLQKNRRLADPDSFQESQMVWQATER